MESRGPIFFWPVANGWIKTFRCLEVPEHAANKDADLKQATRNDSRVTRIGKTIRKTSL